MMKIEMHKAERGDGYDGSMVFWYVFPGNMRNHRITRVVAQSGYDVESEHCQHSYDCCGRWYGSGLYIEKRGSRKLAKITVSRNV